MRDMSERYAVCGSLTCIKLPVIYGTNRSASRLLVKPFIPCRPGGPGGPPGGDVVITKHVNDTKARAQSRSDPSARGDLSDGLDFPADDARVGGFEDLLSQALEVERASVVLWVPVL